MSTQENAAIARQAYDNLNAHDLDKVDAMQTDDFTFEGTGAPGKLNKPQARGYTQGFFTAFPDLHWDITLTVAEGDYVVVNWVGTGTHTGPLVAPSGNATPPTGKKASVMGSNTFRIKGGKIVANQVFFDMTSLLGQLGLMPPM